MSLSLIRHETLKCSILVTLRFKETSQCYSDQNQRHLKTVDF